MLDFCPMYSHIRHKIGWDDEISKILYDKQRSSGYDIMHYLHKNIKICNYYIKHNLKESLREVIKEKYQQKYSKSQTLGKGYGRLKR